jgi:hypothetical protein
MVGAVGLGLMLGALTSQAAENNQESSEARNETTSAVAAKGTAGDYSLMYSYKGKKVLVRLINFFKDRDYVGQCVEEDDESITLQINNNFFTFFFSDIEYIESL